MARLARLYAPGITQLAIASFSDLVARSDALTPAVFGLIQGWLAGASQLYQVPVHGWHIDQFGVGIVATPHDANSVGRLMQSLGRNLSSRVIGGPVFAGRYRSCLLQNGHWVLPTLVWLESRSNSSQNFNPDDRWPWSSAGAHTGLHTAVWHTPHADYWACGNTPFDRQAHYRHRFAAGNSPQEKAAIETALKGQWALGDTPFLNAISGSASRRLEALPRGRPKHR